jgi:hypothetical protein
MAKSNYYLDAQMVNSDYLTQDNYGPSLSPSSFISKTTGTNDLTMAATTKDPCLSGKMVDFVNHHDQPYANFEHLGKSIVHLYKY